MAKRNIEWFLGELEILLETGVITEENKNALKTYYTERLKTENRDSGSKFLGIISMIGGVLIGLGLILLFAYNWDFFSKEGKCVVALLPVILMQGIIIFGKIKGFNSSTFRETTAIILAFAIGGSIALLSQIYHIQGDLDSYLKIWMILIIPLVYLTGSNLTGFIYFVLTIIWSTNTQISGESTILFWIFGVMILPYYYFQVLKKDRFSSSSFFFTYIFIIWILSSVGLSLEKAIPGLWIMIYANMIFLFLIVGTKWFEKSGPFYTIGKAGTLFMAFLFTFVFFWTDIGIKHFRSDVKYNNYGTFMDYVIFTALLIMVIYFIAKEWKIIKKEIAIYSLLPLITLISFVVVSIDNVFIMFVVLIFNLISLAMCIYSIFTGIRDKKIGEVNIGMAVMGLVIGTRFFDIDIGFVGKAIVFMILGAIFILLNLFLKKRMGDNNG